MTIENNYVVGDEVLVWVNIRDIENVYVLTEPTSTVDKDTILGKIIYINPSTDLTLSWCVIEIISNKYKKIINLFEHSDFSAPAQTYLEPGKKYTTCYFPVIAGRYKSSVIQNIKDGEFCCDCGNFFPMAVANLKNDTLLCYSCRSTKSWKYENLL